MKFTIKDFIDQEKRIGKGDFIESFKLQWKFPKKTGKVIAREMTECGFESARKLIEGKQKRGYIKKIEKVETKEKVKEIKLRKETVKCYRCGWSGYVNMPPGYGFKLFEPSMLSKKGEFDLTLYCPRPQCRNRIYKFTGKRETEEECLALGPGYSPQNLPFNFKEK